ncbi:MAG TPA: DNA repair protein RecO [Rhodanobacteraceae bacterium]|nr:DNA repair protein RecO [Rhodanobacteraceae bacterium]
MPATRIDQQPGYVLHARAYRETSLLLEILSRDHGRVGLVARGVRRERTRLPRGLLQPLQPLLFGWIARGELGTLTSVESVAAPFTLGGEALFAGIYLNELVLRLTVRNDAHAAAFGAYADCLAALAAGASVAWTLRRFERELLADLGYALALTHAADTGVPVEADSHYAYDPEAGPLTWRDQPGAFRISGVALLALHNDRMPDPAGLAELRRLMRIVIRHQLDGGRLNAWSFRLPSAGTAADTGAN